MRVELPGAQRAEDSREGCFSAVRAPVEVQGGPGADPDHPGREDDQAVRAPVTQPTNGPLITSAQFG